MGFGKGKLGGGGFDFGFDSPEDVARFNEQRAQMNPFRSGSFRGHTPQKFLPPALRWPQTGDILSTGVSNLGQLLRDPGGVSPTLFDAIEGRREQESQQISQNFENIRQEQAGQAARTNLPVSLKGALSKALDTAQARAERSSTQRAVSESEALRRQDLGQTFNLFDSILQFLSSGRGQATSGLRAAGQLEFGSKLLGDRDDAAALAGLGSALSTLGSGRRGGNDTTG
jgi:hypothetical protein